MVDIPVDSTGTLDATSWMIDERSSMINSITRTATTSVTERRLVVSLPRPAITTAATIISAVANQVSFVRPSPESNGARTNTTIPDVTVAITTLARVVSACRRRTSTACPTNTAAINETITNQRVLTRAWSKPGRKSKARRKTGVRGPRDQTVPTTATMVRGTAHGRVSRSRSAMNIARAVRMTATTPR